MDIAASIQANRAAWNQKTSIHQQSEFYDLAGFKAGKSSLNPLELRLLGEVRGKRVLHLQCHFGMDSISLARLGASVTGVDLSDAAVALAQELAAEEQTDARFVCCNVYDTRAHVGDLFDKVFTSYGTIGWLPDLAPWARVIADSLVAGGSFLIVDFHPALWMMADDFSHIQYPYNSSPDEPIVETISGTYADRDAAITTTTYGWNHSLAKLITALLQVGLQVDAFEEHTSSPYNCFQNIEQGADGQWRVIGLGDKLPMVYALRMVKPA